MELLKALDATAVLVILAAIVIIALIPFAKAIKTALKIAVIAVMLAIIVYFLHDAGLIQIPGLGK